MSMAYIAKIMARIAFDNMRGRSLGLSDQIKKGLNYIKFNGLDGVVSTVRYKMSGPGLSYNGWYKETHEPDEEMLIAQRNTEFPYAPKISILVSVYMTPEFFLRAMIESVQKQTYANWELCIVDGSQAPDANKQEDEQELSVYEQVYSLETEKTIRQYADEDPRIHYELLDKNRGICDNTNRALAMATGDYIALLDHDDILTEDALFHVVSALQDTNIDIVYSDEDKMSEDGTKFSDPAFKTDFNLDLLRSYHYIANFLVVRASLARQVGGFHREFDNARDYDFVLRCTEILASEYGLSSDMLRTKIHHVSRILYHMRMHSHPTEADERRHEISYSTGKKALAAHLERLGLFATVANTDMKGVYHVTYETPGNPLLSIIVTSNGDIDLLEQCIMPLFERTRYSNFEIIIVDGMVDQEIMTAYRKLELKRRNMKVVFCRESDNHNRWRNFAAAQAKGEYLLFVSGDIEIADATSISEMIGCCMRDEIGIVGGTVFSPNGVLLRSGMVIRKDGEVMDAYQGVRKGGFGYLMHNRMNCDYTAISTDCLMIKKDLFDSLGGFSVEVNDLAATVDLGLRTWSNEKIVMCVANARWCKHTKNNEIAYKLKPDSNLAMKYSFYNPNFAEDKAPFSL